MTVYDNKIFARKKNPKFEVLNLSILSINYKFGMWIANDEISFQFISVPKILNKNLQNNSNKYINDFRKLKLFITQDKKKGGGG